MPTIRGIKQLRMMRNRSWTPANLFEGGVYSGVWLDPRDISTLKINTDGSGQVTNNGDLVRRINGKSGRNEFFQLNSEALSTPIYRDTDGKYIELPPHATKASGFSSGNSACHDFLGNGNNVPYSIVAIIENENGWYTSGAATEGFFNVSGNIHEMFMGWATNGNNPYIFYSGGVAAPSGVGLELPGSGNTTTPSGKFAYTLQYNSSNDDTTLRVNTNYYTQTIDWGPWSNIGSPNDSGLFIRGRDVRTATTFRLYGFFAINKFLTNDEYEKLYNFFMEN